MTCQQVAEYLRAYCDGELAPPERAIFDEHLAECPDCVHYLNSYRDTIAISRLAYEDTVAAIGPPPEKLVQAILRARKQ